MIKSNLVLALIDRTYAEARFGSRRGVLKHFYHSVVSTFGGYRQYRRDDFSGVGRLVFICSGNICRSPYAEAKAMRLGVSSVSVGLDTRGGYRADPVACSIASENGICLDSHISQGLSDTKIRHTDLLLCMEVKHAKSISLAFPEYNDQVAILGMVGHYNVPFIPDPFGKSVEYFRHCFEMIDQFVTVAAQETIRQCNASQ